MQDPAKRRRGIGGEKGTRSEQCESRLLTTRYLPSIPLASRTARFHLQSPSHVTCHSLTQCITVQAPFSIKNHQETQSLCQSVSMVSVCTRTAAAHVDMRPQPTSTTPKQANGVCLTRQRRPQQNTSTGTKFPFSFTGLFLIEFYLIRCSSLLLSANTTLFDRHDTSFIQLYRKVLSVLRSRNKVH